MKELEDELRKDMEQYRLMNAKERAAYRRQLIREMEEGKKASAQRLTSKLIDRCRGLDD